MERSFHDIDIYGIILDIDKMRINNMKKNNFEPTFIDQLLLFLADTIDFNLATISFNKSLSYFAGDPSLRKHRQWLEDIMRNKRKKQKFFSALHYLKNRKFIKYINKGNARGVIFLERGDQRLIQINARVERMQRKKKLSTEEWIMVFFDIPEKLKSKRNTLRRRLKELEFQQLQKSIWITQYDIVDFLKKELKELQVNSFVKFLVVKEIKDV